MKKNQIEVSVAMATYNGEKYIYEQIKSILENLEDTDEIIISDDNSSDNTVNLIKEFKDPRIKIIKGPCKGVKQNFANAIQNCKGKYIFLSDQDDIWKSNKRRNVIKFLKKKDVIVVQHDCQVTDVELNVIQESYFKFRGCKNGIIKNIIKGSFLGCCMAFKSEIKDYILPIPNNIDMHDQWIGLIGEKKKGMYFLNDKLIYYRRHENTESNCFKHHSLIRMIKDRIVLIREFIKRCNKL